MKQRSAIWKQPRNFTAGLFYSVSPIQNQDIVNRAQDVKVERHLSSQHSLCYCYQASKTGSLIILSSSFHPGSPHLANFPHSLLSVLTVTL